MSPWSSPWVGGASVLPWEGSRAGTITVLDKDGNPFAVPLTGLDADGNEFTISRSGLDADGNTHNV